MRPKFLTATALALAVGLTSCMDAGPCSDLEIGEELAVTIQAPLGNNPCDPALGVVSGAVIHLSVEEEGDTHTCTTMMGPTTILGVDLTYQSEQSYNASGDHPFVSASDVDLGPCTGSLVVALQSDDPVQGAPDTFSTIRVLYAPVLDSECPRSCDLNYSVTVTRM